MSRTVQAGPTAAAVSRETASLTIPGRPEQLRLVRALVTRTLVLDGGQADTAALLTTELVSNSLRHSRSRRPGGVITINLIALRGGIRVEVLDQGAEALPAPRSSPAEPELAESGRGLQIISTLAVRWGYSRSEAGTLTWFELGQTAPAE